MLVAPYLDTLLLLLVTAAAINDLASRRIPNLLLLSGLVAALVFTPFHHSREKPCWPAWGVPRPDS